MSHRNIALASFAVLVAAGCAPTYAPPPRTAHDFAPGRLAAREAGLGGTYLVNAQAGEGRVRLPVTDRAWVETGGTFNEDFVLGTLGARINTFDSGPRLARWVLDVDFGLAAGAGGELCGNKDAGDESCDGDVARPDGADWSDRLAYGTYAGGGVAVHLTEGVAPYARFRVQASKTTNVPVTFWLSGVIGIDLRYEWVSLYGAVGLAGFTNDYDQQGGLILETGLTFHLGT